MNWQQLLALLQSLGLTAPLDLTDPRVTPEQLAELYDTVEAKFVELRPGADIGQLSQLRDAQKALKVEFQARWDADLQKQADLAKLAELDAAGEPEAPAAEVPADTADKVAPDTVVIGAQAGAEPDPVVPVVDLAKVASVQAPGDQGGAAVHPSVPKVKFHAASAAGLGTSNIGQEIEIESIGPRISEMARQMEQNARGGGRPMEKAVLASVPPAHLSGVADEAIVTNDKSAAQNTEIIKTYLADHRARLAAAAAGTEYVKTAAAPWCEPFDRVREIPDCVNTETPVFNSLPFVPMGYGGFVFNSGVGVSDLDGAVDIWTAADQAAIDPSDPATWKRCLALACPGALPQITLDDWLTACVEWQVGMDLNNPERFRDYFLKLEARRARLKEQYTLALLDVLLKNYKNDAGFSSPAIGVGGLTDLIGALISMFQTSEYNERSNDRNGYTLYLDTHIIDTLVYAEYGAAYAKSSATRESIKAVIVATVAPIDRVIEVMDRVPGQYGTVQANGNPRAAMPADNQTPVVVPELVNAGRIRAIPTAEVFAFGTGEIRTGVTQDFSYVRQNKVGWFAEEAFALTKYGCQPWFALNATIRPAGFYVGLINRSITAETAVAPFTAAYVADNAAANQPDPNP